MATPRKEWTAKNAKIGTHHKNREGVYVDFRKASVMLNKYGDSPEIHICPPKGQAVAPVVLQPTRQEKIVVEKDSPKNGMQCYKMIFFTEFLGVEVSVESPVKSEYYDESARLASIAASEKWEAEYKKHRTCSLEFVKNFPREGFFGKVTDSELGRIQSGRLSISEVLERILREEYKNEFGEKLDVDWKVMDRLLEIKIAGGMLLVMLEKNAEWRRKENKKAWMAKK